ncbi:MAG: hypothetical protein QOH01_403 [Verrucomicrobiota bacterium]|jgi:hypothetical protein
MPSNPADDAKRKDEASAREKTPDSADKETLQPAREKIPEGEGNLRRRADWFQKRTGGTP